MIKEKLTLLNDKPNFFQFPQSTIDTFKVDDSEKELYLSSVKLFQTRTKGHFTNKYVNFHVNNGMEYIDIIRIKKYPLPAAYNIPTKRIVINISALQKRLISNINPRDLYTILVYSHVCAMLSSSKKISVQYADPFCQYLAFVFLKIFSKMYGITGSYVDFIPQLKFLVYSYVLASFFSLDQKSAISKASRMASFDPKRMNVKLSSYDFNEISDLIKVLSDSNVTPGLNNYRFLDKMIRNFGTMNLVFFEDIMRFSCIMMSSTINGNSYFSPAYQIYNPKLYFKINEILESVLK